MSTQAWKSSISNFPDPDFADWEHAYYGTNLRRLLRVKRKYNPDDYIRDLQSLPGRI